MNFRIATRILRDWKFYYFIVIIGVWYLILTVFSNIDITKSSFLSSTFDPSQPVVLSNTAFNYIAPLLLFLLTTLTTMEYDQYKLSLRTYREVLGNVLKIAQRINGNLDKIDLAITTSINVFPTVIFRYLVQMKSSKRLVTNRIVIEDFTSDLTKSIKTEELIQNEDKQKMLKYIEEILSGIYTMEGLDKSPLPQTLYYVIVWSSIFFYTLMLPSLWSTYSYLLGTTIYLFLVTCFVTTLNATNELYPIFSEDSETYFELKQSTEDIKSRVDKLLDKSRKINDSFESL